MNFKSQICTTREQSERLLALGMKAETADMVYHFTKSKVEWWQWELQPNTPTLRGEYWTPQRIAKLASPFHKHADGSRMTGEEVFDEIWGKDVPAWSLSRLLEIIPHNIEQQSRSNADLDINSDGQYWFVSYDELGYDTMFQTMKHNLFDALIDMIAWLVDSGNFNKDYLIDSGKEDNK